MSDSVTQAATVADTVVDTPTATTTVTPAVAADPAHLVQEGVKVVADLAVDGKAIQAVVKTPTVAEATAQLPGVIAATTDAVTISASEKSEAATLLGTSSGRSTVASWILTRASEKSTWAGLIAGGVSIFGIQMGSTLGDAIAGVAASVAALLLVILKTKTSK